MNMPFLSESLDGRDLGEGGRTVGWTGLVWRAGSCDAMDIAVPWKMGSFLTT